MAIAMAGLLLAGVVATAGAATWGAVRAARAARETATIDAFVAEILTTARPDQAGAEVRLIDAVDDALEEIDTRFAGQPRIEIGVRRLIGEVLPRVQR